MMKINEYNGYKMVIRGQFPIWAPDFNTADQRAHRLNHETGKDVEVWGIMGYGTRYLYTVSAYKPRT